MNIAFTTPAAQMLVLLLMYCATRQRVVRFAPQWCGNIEALVALCFQYEAVVPVKGHCPSNKFCVTLSTDGVLRIDCSAIREKPNSSPPHPAKRKSIPTKTIINLVGMVATGPVGSAWNEMKSSEGYGARKEWKLSAAEPSGVLSRL
jgi:hypothetical protein